MSVGVLRWVTALPVDASCGAVVTLALLWQILGIRAKNLTLLVEKRLVFWSTPAAEICGGSVVQAVSLLAAKNDYLAWRILQQLLLGHCPFGLVQLDQLLLRKLLWLRILQSAFVMCVGPFEVILGALLKTSIVLDWLARCPASITDFEEVFGLAFHIIFDLELVQIKHHVLEHVNGWVLRFSQEISRCLFMVTHPVENVRVSGWFCRRWILQFLRQVDKT